jgi:hypothetical protein
LAMMAVGEVVTLRVVVWQAAVLTYRMYWNYNLGESTIRVRQL